MGKDYMGEFDIPLEEIFADGAVTNKKVRSCATSADKTSSSL